MTTPAEKYGLEKPECGILEHAGYPFHIIGRVISALMDAGARHWQTLRTIDRTNRKVEGKELK